MIIMASKTNSCKAKALSVKTSAILCCALIPVQLVTVGSVRACQKTLGLVVGRIKEAAQTSQACSAVSQLQWRRLLGHCLYILATPLYVCRCSVLISLESHLAAMLDMLSLCSAGSMEALGSMLLIRSLCLNAHKSKFNTMDSVHAGHCVTALQPDQID